jgi:hypothetical protein
MNVKPQCLMLAMIVLLLSASGPAAAHHTTTHSTCAPVSYCGLLGCYYELLNNPEFSGTYATCTNWFNAAISTAAECSNSKVATVTSTSGAFTQNFSVPSDAVGTLDLGIEFATIGTPASALDKVVFELYEGTTLRKTIAIATQGIDTSCHREDLTLSLTPYAGRNLQLRVGAVFVTAGVSYKFNWVQLFVAK